MPAHLFRVPALRAAALLLLLSGCGGGGGSSPPPPPPLSLSVTPGTIQFQAALPYGLPPAAQTVRGTVTGTGSGTLYVTVIVGNGNLITAGAVTVAGNAGTSDITPALPETLGPGTYQTTITVHACLNDPTCQTGEISGSPAVVQVSYVVPDSVQADSVTPHQVMAQAAGGVILRGHGLAGVTSVTAGGLAATSVTVVGDSEVHATLPALPAGAQAIQLNGGAVAFTGSVDAVAEPAYPAGTIAWPEALDFTTTVVQHLEYRAAQQALFATLSTGQPATHRLYRYQYGSGWSATHQADITGYVDFDASSDGLHLYVTYPDRIEVLDAATLALQRTVNQPAVSGTVYDFHSLGLTNDGIGVVTCSIPGSGNAPLFFLSTTQWTFAQLGTWPEDIGQWGPEDGSYSAIGGSYYFATYGAIRSNPTDLRAEYQPRWVGYQMGGGTPTSALVFQRNPNFGNDTQLGGIDIPAGGIALATDARALRAYLMDVNGLVQAWDISGSPVNGLFPAIGQPQQAIAPGPSYIQSPLVVTRSLDGHTAFVGFTSGITVLHE